MKNKKVFVTGGTGFVGAYLIRYLLQKGYKIKALKRAQSPMGLIADIQNQVEWVEGDILDLPFLEKALKGVDQIYHSAAMISFDPKKVQQMLKINIEGTANIVNIALELKIEKLVHISSIAALGRKEFQPNVDESIQWENSKENSNYAISKFKAEAEVWRGIEEGLNAAIVNPAVILGAGYWDSGSCKLFEKVAKGLSYYPSGSTGFVDVRDVAKAAIAVMESTIVAERYILNGSNTSYQAFFVQTAQALGKSIPTKKAAAWLVSLLCKVEWLRSQIMQSDPLLTKETARTSQSTYYYDNAKIKKEFNYQFIPFEQTIKETAVAFEKSKQNNENFGRLPLV
jgi:dihydroflavonol-4-reductase